MFDGLRGVAQADAVEAEGPVVEETGFIDKAEGVDCGEGDDVVPVDVAVDEVVVEAAEGLYGVVDGAGAFRGIGRPGIVVVEADVVGGEWVGLVRLSERRFRGHLVLCLGGSGCCLIGYLRFCPGNTGDRPNTLSNGCVNGDWN